MGMTAPGFIPAGSPTCLKRVSLISRASRLMSRCRIRTRDGSGALGPARALPRVCRPMMSSVSTVRTARFSPAISPKTHYRFRTACSRCTHVRPLRLLDLELLELGRISGAVAQIRELGTCLFRNPDADSVHQVGLLENVEDLRNRRVGIGRVEKDVHGVLAEVVAVDLEQPRRFSVQRVLGPPHLLHFELRLSRRAKPINEPLNDDFGVFRV